MSFRPAICSHSLGRAWRHDIIPKLTAASAAGLPGIEIFYEDLHYLAAAYPGGTIPANIWAAARHIRSLCDSLSLSILAIGPFADCEGLLSPAARAAKHEQLQIWFNIARILGTDMIQIPCTFKTEADGFTGDIATVVRDLQEVADMGAASGLRFAYENLCFGSWNDTWEKAWAVVRAVDRQNFGLCLDTFNICGREYADPACPTGKVPNADTKFRESMARMVAKIDPTKIFYVQVVDAERLAKPLVPGHELHVDGQRARMSWSRNCRLFLGEEDRGGYLPVWECLKAICNKKEEGGLGYRGWISMELFNRSLIREGNDVPQEHAERAVESWRKIVSRMGWEEVDKPLIKMHRTTLTAQPKQKPMQENERSGRRLTTKTDGMMAYGRLIHL